MAPRGRGENHQTINTFKGVNLSDPPHVIDEREFQSVGNLIVNDAGDLIRRKPMRWFTSMVNDTGPPGAEITRTGTSTNYAVGCRMLGIFYGRLVFSDDHYLNISPVDTDLTNENHSIDLQAGPPSIDFTGNPAVLYNDSLYWLTGMNVTNDTIAKVTIDDWGVNHPFSTVTDLEVASYYDGLKGVIFKDRYFVIKWPGMKSSRIAYSNLNDPMTSPASNFFDVNPGDGDFVTDLIPFGERLYIFKRFSTWVLIASGLPSSWILKLFDGAVGATDTNTVLEYRGLLYVLSPRGLYRMDGTVYDYVGYQVQDRWKDQDTGPAVGKNYSAQIVMVDDNIFVNSSNTSIGYWFYNPVQSAWTECFLPDLPMGQLGLGYQGTLKSGERSTFFGKATPNGQTQRMQVIRFGLADPDYVNNGEYADYVSHHDTPGSRIITPVATSFKTKFWDLGSFFKTKRHKLSALEVEVPEQSFQGDVEFTTRHHYDRDAVTDDWEFNVPVTARGNMVHQIPGVGMNRRLQLELNSTTTADYSVTGYDLTYLVKRDDSENPV